MSLPARSSAARRGRRRRGRGRASEERGQRQQARPAKQLAAAEGGHDQSTAMTSISTSELPGNAAGRRDGGPHRRLGAEAALEHLVHPGVVLQVVQVHVALRTFSIDDPTLSSCCWI